MELIHHKGMQATVRAIDGDRAVLLLPDGQIVRWPLNLLPASTKIGDEVALHTGLHELAHAVLNKIFAEGDAEVS